MFIVVASSPTPYVYTNVILGCTHQQSIPLHWMRYVEFMCEILQLFSPAHLAKLSIHENSPCLFPKCWNWQCTSSTGCSNFQFALLSLNIFHCKIKDNCASSQLNPWYSPVPKFCISYYICNICNTAILKQKSYNSTTNMLKAYLSNQPSSLSAFMISKTHGGAQKPCINSSTQKYAVAKVPYFLSSLFNNNNLRMVRVLTHETAADLSTQVYEHLASLLVKLKPWQALLAHCSCCLLEIMCTGSLVLRPQITAFCLGMRLAQAISVSMYVMQVPSLCLAQAWGRYTMLWQNTGKMLSTNKSCLVPLTGFHFTIYKASYTGLDSCNVQKCCCSQQVSLQVYIGRLLSCQL